MTFKLSTVKETFSINVEVFTANNKCGHDKSNFVAIFSRTDVSELDRLMEMKFADVCRESLVGWDQFLDDDGKPVPFNDETKEALISITEVVSGLAVAYWQAFSKQKLKN